MANKKIKIHFSEEDLQELQNGETFDWTFDGVDVHLYLGYDDEDGKNCIKCGNPKIMYWCPDCEHNQETDCCDNCDKGRLSQDEDYHLTCN